MRHNKIVQRQHYTDRSTADLTKHFYFQISRMSNIIFYQYVQLEEFIFSAKKQLPVFVPLTEIKQCETTLTLNCLHFFFTVMFLNRRKTKDRTWKKLMMCGAVEQ